MVFVRSSLTALCALVAAAFGVYAHRDQGLTDPRPAAMHAVQMAKPSEPPEVVRASSVVEVVRTAPEHGLPISRYGVDELQTALSAARTSNADPQELANLDQMAVKVLVAFGRDVALGRTSPSQIDPNWKRLREVPEVLSSPPHPARDSVTAWIREVQPQHQEYTALQRVLQNLRLQQTRGGWPTVPAEILQRGGSGAAVAVLRQRLAANGELARSDIAVAEAYDADVEQAVKTFQVHHALPATGRVDKATLAALNVPIENRIRQVELNLERWRWAPDDLGERHFLVNIPAYVLIERDHGKTVREIRAIVGKPGHETPVFSGRMETVVFSPYWNVPDSIAEDETAPAAARDPDYLAKNDIEVLRRSKSGARVVSADEINWYDPAEWQQISFRQKPGAKNALGHVKFLFPNRFNVYIHDTPTDTLFDRSTRAFSHGCVRIADPEALAEDVLRDRSEWDEERISAAMNAGVEKWVHLDQTIPVHIVYLTTWVGDDGQPYFLPDVYGYDARQLKLMK